MLREFHSLSRQSPNFRTSAAAWLIARVNKEGAVALNKN